MPIHPLFAHRHGEVAAKAGADVRDALLELKTIQAESSDRVCAQIERCRAAGCTLDEIAGTLGCSRQAVHQRLVRYQRRKASSG